MIQDPNIDTALTVLTKFSKQASGVEGVSMISPWLDDLCLDIEGLLDNPCIPSYSNKAPTVNSYETM